MSENQQSHIEELTTEKTEFKREIGLFGGISVIGGIVIGSGIFYLGSYVLQYVGMSEGMALLCWIIGGVLSIMGGLCYAEMGSSIPRAGGQITYLSEAFSPIFGCLAGYSAFLIGDPASSAALAVALVTALLGTVVSSTMIKILAIILIIALCVYNYYGVKHSNALQSVTMAAKLIPILVIIVAAISMGTIKPDLSLVVKDATGGSKIGMIALGVMATLWAYEGWYNLNNVAEEVKNPSKNLPRALIISLGGITLLYTMFNFAIYKTLPWDTINTEINVNENLYLGTLVSKNLMGNFGSILVVTCMVIAMLGSLNGCLMIPPRNYYAMAKEKHFFSAFGKLDENTKVPYWGFIIEGIIAIIFVLWNTLQDLTILVAFTSLLYNTLTVLSVPRLRKKYPDINRPYKVWIGLPYIYMACQILLIIYTITTDTRNSLIGLGAQLIGVAIYFFFDVQNKKQKAAAEQ